MTFLAGTTTNQSDPDYSHDHYFEATRMLGYQLLHDPETKTRRSIPFLILVTEDVSHEKRDRLTKDGAIVIPVPYLIADKWLVGTEPRWRDVVTKLRAWETKDYSRILFIDGDTIINRCLDGIFNDPAAQYRAVIQDRIDDALALDTDDPFGSQYVFASLPETSPGHQYPPLETQYKGPQYLTAGFFLFSPSPQIFDFHVSLMGEEGRFDPTFPEQNLLNHAHRAEGKLPWQRLSPEWNVNFPTMNDMRAGVASMHEKWWSEGIEVELHTYILNIRWKMESFYEGRDLGLVD